MFTQFRALVRKDILIYTTDRRALLMTLVAPIVIGSFFGYIFGGGQGKSETSRIPILAVDNDGSAISREIVSRLSGDKTLDVKPSSLEGARAAVRKGKATVAIVIPAGFGAAAGRAFFRSASKPEITLLYDPSHGTELSMAQGILAGHVMEAVSKEMFTGQEGRQSVRETLAEVQTSRDMPPDEKKSLTELLHGVDSWNALNDRRQGSGAMSQGLSLPYEARAQAVTANESAPYNGYAHSFGGMGIQFVLFLGIDVGIGLLLQRQRGLWKRLRAAPLARGLLLASRATSAALLSFFVLATIFVFARVVFGVRIQGSLAGFLGICAAFSLLTGAFGLLIASLGRTPEASRGISILATLLLVMLGGSWVPTFVFPPWLQKLTVAIPTRWAMDGIDAMTWRGLGFSAAAGPIAALTLCALLAGALAVLRFRWDEE